MKKGQSGIEYLLIFGAAIIIVLIVALVFMNLEGAGENQVGDTFCSFRTAFGGGYHSADVDKNWKIDATERNYVTSIVTSGGDYYCNSSEYSGYSSGTGSHDCSPHDSDYNPRDWKISVIELTSLIAFENAGGYHVNCSATDGFEPGA